MLPWPWLLFHLKIEEKEKTEWEEQREEKGVVLMDIVEGSLLLVKCLTTGTTMAAAIAKSSTDSRIILTKPIISVIGSILSRQRNVHCEWSRQSEEDFHSLRCRWGSKSIRQSKKERIIQVWLTVTEHRHTSREQDEWTLCEQWWQNSFSKKEEAARAV